MIGSLLEIESARKYLGRINASPRSLREAVVRIDVGNYWRDVAHIKFAPDGEVEVSNEVYAPTEHEREEMKRDFPKYDFPGPVKLESIERLPEGVFDDDNLFTFKDHTGRIVMLQQRKESRESGEKRYFPYTYWSDGQWRCCEPEGLLPLYNLDKAKGARTAFLHEGAKSARFCQRLVDLPEGAEHPWIEELRNGVHLGWISGALSPQRTDFDILRRLGIGRVYIVADNDWPGKMAVPKIAERLDCMTLSLEFTDEFPPAFDLGDEFPKAFWKEWGGESYYRGPSFHDCLHPATWATDIVPPEKKGGRPGFRLRDHFKSMWGYVEEADLFVCLELPQIIRSESILNKMLAKFSHVKNTTELILKNHVGRYERLAYRPDVARLILTDGESSAINIHIPTKVDCAEGSPHPFLEFMEHLVPNPEERKVVLSWCATLIAKPEVKMGFALLMISELQGAGKTTLGEKILSPLVGEHNTGNPSSENIMSNYNHWLAMKRLIIINEIYEGRSWNMYNKLKSAITDRKIHVNKKYEREYDLENWGQFYACSNTLRALKIEDTDRRWYVPDVAEIHWGGSSEEAEARFMKLWSWLETNGLGIIRQWAEDWGEYLPPGRHAPMTDRKRDIAEGAKSRAVREVERLADAMMASEAAKVVSMKSVEDWLRHSVLEGERFYETRPELSRVLTKAGLARYSWVKLGGERQNVYANEEGKGKIDGYSGSAGEIIKELCEEPNRILQEEF